MPSLKSILRVDDVTGTLARIDSNWPDHAAKDDAVKIIEELFPGTGERDIPYTGFYWRLGKTMVCTKEYGTGAIQMDAYSSKMTNLTRGASSAFRDLKDNNIVYSVNDLDVELTPISQTILAWRSWFQGGLLLSLLTFAIGVILTSAMLPQFWFSLALSAS